MTSSSELVLTPDYMQVAQQYISGEAYGRGHMLSANIVYYSYVYICSIITVSYFVHWMITITNSGCLDKLSCITGHYFNFVSVN